MASLDILHSVRPGVDLANSLYQSYEAPDTLNRLRKKSVAIAKKYCPSMNTSEYKFKTPELLSATQKVLRNETLGYPERSFSSQVSPGTSRRLVCKSPTPTGQSTLLSRPPTPTHLQTSLISRTPTPTHLTQSRVTSCTPSSGLCHIRAVGKSPTPNHNTKYTLRSPTPNQVTSNASVRGVTMMVAPAQDATTTSNSDDNSPCCRGAGEQQSLRSSSPYEFTNGYHTEVTHSNTSFGTRAAATFAPTAYLSAHCKHIARRRPEPPCLARQTQMMRDPPSARLTPAAGLTCTARELEQIITEPSGGQWVIPVDACNEVYPDVFISDMSTALCTQLLVSLGVTHVLNAAQKMSGTQAPGYYVNTSPGYYSRSGIRYLGVPATDSLEFDLSPYFEQAAHFIDEALESKGRVLVHCHQGISRSATLVLAFLILRRGMTAQQAMRTVRSKREVIPNQSFLRQLCELNNRMVGGRRQYLQRY